MQMISLISPFIYICMYELWVQYMLGKAILWSMYLQLMFLFRIYLTKKWLYNLCFHYANMPIDAICSDIKGCKNVNFEMKKFDIFLIFAQHIDCGYTLQLPQ